MTARVPDTNGWYEVRRNPISKVGVFPYLGRQLGLTGDKANKVFNVYRPAEELSSPETMDSFRLLPLIDDHTMLGDVPGAMDAPDKGVHGVIGDQVVFDGRTLHANLKVFSRKLANKIKSGKKELSAGYRCVYDFTPGTFDGKAYDAVQRRLRGNHLALVDRGRMGPDVAVLDQMAITVDAEDFRPMNKTLAAAIAAAAAARAAGASAEVIAACDAAVTEAQAEVTALDGASDELQAAQDAATAAKAAQDAAEAALKTTQDELAALKAAKTGNGQDGAAVVALTAEVETLKTELATLKTAKPAMDEATMFVTLAQRDALAKRLIPHIGVFDHAEKTLAQVVAYGVEKLALKNITAGHELTALDAYLTAAPIPRALPAQDGGAPKEGAISKYLSGAKAA